MKIDKKSATITNTDESADAFPGTFEVVLSTPTTDRDGDSLLASEWKTPLPDHITFDVDHGMSVKSTVGSGVPSIDDEGRLIVKGSYSSLQQAQDVRTLVNEKHIRTVSVAFLTEPASTKDGVKTVKRELLNGAFVAIPANPEAVVLSSKSLADDAEVKAGARHSAADASLLQAAHDALVAMGASCSPAEADTEQKSLDADQIDETDTPPSVSPDVPASSTEAPVTEKATDADDIALKYRALQTRIATTV